MGYRSASMALVLLVSMLLAIPDSSHVKADMGCKEVTIKLMPCISYGVFGGTVAPDCCKGFKSLLAEVKTPKLRRKKCKCVKDGAAMIPGLNYTRVNEIPALCGTTSYYKVTPDVDCSKVK